ncbi:MAG: hypothetical protein MSH34_03960 [Oscillospiraceae bacterium]|nr:hypothetical protein [Oscillospiraceae bacterium]
MDDEKSLKAQLAEAKWNITLTKRLLKKAEAGQIRVSPGAGVTITAPYGQADILKGQLRDLEIQKGDIEQRLKKFMEVIDNDKKKTD